MDNLDTTETVSISSRKRVWRVEILNDLDGNFEFIARIQKITFLNGAEVGQEDLGCVSVLHDEALLDEALAPQIENLKGACQELIKRLGK